MPGKIIWKSTELIPGGFVKKGSRILQIDKSSYLLKKDTQQAQVSQMKLRLDLEWAQQKIAEKDFKRLEPTDMSPESLELALRKPHLEQAKAALVAANSSLKEAELQLNKTSIRAPYNAIVLNENVSIGSYASPQTPLASIMGTDAVWAQVSVPVSKLNLIQLPDSKGKNGSKATVRQVSSHSSLVWKGEVTRMLGELDPLGHMAQLLIRIENPFENHGGKIPLLPGANVQSTIEGKVFETLIAIPSEAVSDGRYVWLYQPDSTLFRREVDVAFKNRTKVFISSGLHAGDKVVVTPIRAPINGMEVTLVGSTNE